MEPGTYFRCFQNSKRESYPDPKSTYIICKDGSIQNILNPERSVGWKVVVRGTVHPPPDAISSEYELLFKGMSAAVLLPFIYFFIVEYPLVSAFIFSVNYVEL